jgi:2-polyprenyl-6-hydroxyphenyl methylase / 3-demethylubiquinone-9 3-methyltransferase
MNPSAHSGSTYDSAEVARFAKLASDWWDASGPHRQLHRLNPVRLAHIRDRVCQQFERDAKQARPLAGLEILDIGCGGGLVCEPLARLGARVTGIDPEAESIGVARAHAEGAGLDITYEAETAEALAARGQAFDAVLLLEVVEHVPDVPAFLKVCAPLVKPGGAMILSTLNRTLKSFALAIVGAEYVLRWIPVGTHDWQRFVKPEELAEAASCAGLKFGGTSGMIYNPLADEWRLGADTDVNYIATALRPQRADQ